MNNGVEWIFAKIERMERIREIVKDGGKKYNKRGLLPFELSKISLFVNFARSTLKTSSLIFFCPKSCEDHEF